MDKKMRVVSKQMEAAEHEIAKGKPKLAEKTLKAVVKRNEKLVRYDKNVRDPLIDRCKKQMKRPQGRGR